MERISIHAPRTGSDNINYKAYGTPQISIHAPRTGSDANLHRRTSRRWYFNPRSPHGERPDFRRDVFGNQQFQSTLPARGATPPAACRRRTPPISIHAPRTGSDRSCARTGMLSAHFNPRSPHGERPDSRRRKGKTPVFQSTLPARGATAVGAQEQRH